MSLDVPPEVMEKAERGQVDLPDFVACIRESLPYAYETVSRVAGNLKDGVPSSNGSTQFADNTTEPPDEATRGQLLRALASDSIKGALEQHFQVKLVFQNCHRVAAFPLSEVGSDTYTTFISPRAQLLNQSPELRSC
ncbi:SCO5389 family protein [Natronoglycomyces albus]|uniref:Uncharacterized protein n=1 Tax=Natronoglycomyces albus TaxID=2811108 RepID=A0A895XMM9_9ACTN|nr:SCO5389 family protein [Natronoglycomyces albus]QSB04275.1 hypothetical protein JQS30_10730 [Natronoglycomyces albus]